MRIAATLPAQPTLPEMHNPDLEEAIFMLAGALETIRGNLVYNLQNGGRYSEVLSQENLMETVGNIKTVSKAAPEAVKDVLRDAKRRYQLKHLHFLRTQDMQGQDEKLKYMTQNEINRLSALITTIDQMKNRTLLEEKNVSAIAWLINLSNALDKCGEYEKADALDSATTRLVRADTVDPYAETVDLVLAAVREFGPTNIKRLTEFLVGLSPFQIADLESAAFGDQLPAEDQSDLMLAWQILDKETGATDDVNTQSIRKLEPVFTKGDDVDPQYPGYTTKLNQRVFNLLYVTANSLDKHGKETEAAKLDLALSVLARLKDEFDEEE